MLQPSFWLQLAGWDCPTNLVASSLRHFLSIAGRLFLGSHRGPGKKNRLVCPCFMICQVRLHTLLPSVVSYSCCFLDATQMSGDVSLQLHTLELDGLNFECRSFSARTHGVHRPSLLSCLNLEGTLFQHLKMVFKGLPAFLSMDN